MHGGNDPVESEIGTGAEIPCNMFTISGLSVL